MYADDNMESQKETVDAMLSKQIKLIMIWVKGTALLPWNIRLIECTDSKLTPGYWPTGPKGSEWYLNSCIYLSIQVYIRTIHDLVVDNLNLLVFTD